MSLPNGFLPEASGGDSCSHSSENEVRGSWNTCKICGQGYYAGGVPCKDGSHSSENEVTGKWNICKKCGHGYYIGGKPCTPGLHSSENEVKGKMNICKKCGFEYYAKSFRDKLKQFGNDLLDSRGGDGGADGGGGE